MKRICEAAVAMLAIFAVSAMASPAPKKTQATSATPLLIAQALSGSECPSGAAHCVVVNWTASSDGAANPTLGYNVYRGTASGGETKITSAPVGVNCPTSGACTFTDTGSAVAVGAKLFYEVKATLNGTESVPSNEASVAIPPAPPTGVTAVAQ